MRVELGDEHDLIRRRQIGVLAQRSWFYGGPPLIPL
jgi:hypothetical protein